MFMPLGMVTGMATQISFVWGIQDWGSTIWIDVKSQTFVNFFEKCLNKYIQLNENLVHAVNCNVHSLLVMQTSCLE